MSLRLRLAEVSERAVLFQIVKDVVNDPKQYPCAVREFCESIDCFSKFLTDKEYFATLLPILDTQCPLQSIIGFSKSMSSVSSTIHTTSFRDVMTILQWLKYVIEKHIQTVIFDSLKVRETDDESIELYQEFAKACMNIPDKVSNCHAKASTEEHVKYINGIKEMLKIQVLEGIQKSLLYAHERLEKNKTRPNLSTVSILISGGREIFLGKILKFISKIQNFGEFWRHITSKIFQEPSELGCQVHEALLTSLFLMAKSEDVLRRCIDTRVLTGTLKRVVMVKLPFQRILTIRNLRILVNFVHRTSEQAAGDLFETSLELWSDWNFARKATEKQERHLVRIILYSIHLFLKSQETAESIPWSNIFLHSMNGIHSRVDLLPTHIQSALFLNETLCDLAQKYLPPGFQKPKPVEMKEKEKDDKSWIEVKDQPNKTRPAWLEEMRRILAEGLDETRKKSDYEALQNLDDCESDDNEQEEFERNGEEKHTEMRGKRDNSSRLRLDSDEKEELEVPGQNPHLVESESESDTDGITQIPPQNSAPLDSDDDEDFPTYRVSDVETNLKKMEIGEEPRAKVTPPAYIADAFEMLLEREKYEIFEAAFFSLKGLIQRKAIGFKEIAEKLFVRIVFLQDHFGTKNFTETCEDIAVSCVVNRPEIVPSLVRLIISPGQGLQTQTRFLHYIHEAADKLGTLGSETESMVHGSTQKFLAISMDWPNVSLLPPETHQPNFDDLVRKRIAQKTRRFGSERKRPELMEVNRLSKKSRYMFYPLLVLPRGENVGLFNKDQELLAHIIMVASMVFVRCGVTHSTAQMTTELISYVTPHRYSDNMKLRAACIIAHLNVMAIVPGEILQNLFSSAVRKEWQDWAESVQHHAATGQLEYGMARQLKCLMEHHFQQHDETVNFDN